MGFAVDKVTMGQVFFLALGVFRQSSLQKCPVFTFIRLPSTVYGRHSDSVATYTTKRGATITEKKNITPQKASHSTVFQARFEMSTSKTQVKSVIPDPDCSESCTH